LTAFVRPRLSSTAFCAQLHFSLSCIFLASSATHLWWVTYVFSRIASKSLYFGFCLFSCPLGGWEICQLTRWKSYSPATVICPCHGNSQGSQNIMHGAVQVLLDPNPRGMISQINRVKDWWNSHLSSISVQTPFIKMRQLMPLNQLRNQKIRLLIWLIPTLPIFGSLRLFRSPLMHVILVFLV
jgi:hypothetical protein